MRFPVHAPLQGDDARLTTLAAHEIHSCCQPIFGELACVIRLNAHAARCMQAKCVLAALLAVRARRPAWDGTQVEAPGARWLPARALAGCGGFFAYKRVEGSCALALDRRTCCHHYRRREGEPRSICPRRDRSERIARLSAERKSRNGWTPAACVCIDAVRATPACIRHRLKTACAAFMKGTGEP